MCGFEPVGTLMVSTGPPWRARRGWRMEMVSAAWCVTQTSPACAEPSPATNRRLMPVRDRVIVMVMSSMAGVLLSIFIEDSDVKRDYKISIKTL